MDWTLDWTALRLLLDLFVLMGVVAIGLYTWYATRSQATKAAIDTVDLRVADVERRVSDVEHDMRHLPTHSDIAELSTRIGTLHGDLREVAGTLRGLQRAVDLMNEHLIRQGGQQ